VQDWTKGLPARMNRSVVTAPCPRRHPQPDAVLLESHRGFVVKASPCLSPGPRLGSEEVHKTVKHLVVVLAESTNDNETPPRFCSFVAIGGSCTLGNTTSSSFLAATSRSTTALRARASIHVSPLAAKRVP
jgi:hypothetical protein